MGVFDDEAEARRARERLRKVGLERHDEAEILAEPGALTDRLRSHGLPDEDIRLFAREASGGACLLVAYPPQANAQAVEEAMRGDFDKSIADRAAPAVEVDHTVRQPADARIMPRRPTPGATFRSYDIPFRDV